MFYTHCTLVISKEFLTYRPTGCKLIVPLHTQLQIINSRYGCTQLKVQGRGLDQHAMNIY